jgi:hypothetical protein
MARRGPSFWRMCADFCLTDVGLEICLDLFWFVLEMLLAG